MVITPTPVYGTQSITLAWNPVTNADVAGYKIYYGSASRTYTNTISVGNVTSATVSGLVDGATYYFAATTLSTAGLESSFSDEVNYTVPTTTPAVQVTPGSIGFGTILSGTTKTGSFTVQNAGGGTLSGTASVSAPFSIVSGGSYNLTNNQSQTVTVSFSPTGAGNYSQNVTLTGGGGASVALTGGATNVPVNPVIQVTPSSLALGTILSGTSKTGSFTVQNVGNGTLSGTASVGAPFSIISGANYSLNSNQSQTVTVAFNPTAAGSYSQNVTLTGGNGASVAVAGNATNAPVLPTVSVISVDATDVDLNLPGLQIYTGTTLQLSATANNAQTWQWSYTVNGGSPVVYTNSTSPITNISCYFGTNTVGDSYVWTLTVSNGLSWAQTQTNLTVEALPNPGQVITNIISGPTVSATSGALSGLLTSSTTINGVPTSYWYQPLFSLGSTTGGTATYNVTITNAGDYEIEALVYAPNANADSFLVNIDGQPQRPSMLWDVTPYTSSGFEERTVSWRGNGSAGNDQFTPQVFSLSAGQHQLVFVGNQPGTAMASFQLLQVVTTTNWINNNPTPPVVTSTPTNYVAVAGQTITLNAAMDISSPSALNYQWQFESANLPSETNAPLTLPTVSTNQSGTYALVVANAGGARVSSPVTLSVYPTTAATLTGAARVQGQFNMTVSGIPGYRYVVEASTNMTDWVPLQTNQAPFLFTDPDAGKFKQRFYRSFPVNSVPSSN